MLTDDKSVPAAAPLTSLGQADPVLLERQRQRALEINRRQLELIQAAIERTRRREQAYRRQMQEIARDL